MRTLLAVLLPVAVFAQGRPDSTRADSARNPLPDLGIAVGARLETKMDRTRNERCVASQLFSLAAQCRGSFQPTFDFQFNVRTAGSIADRVLVNVDYDSQREFDASNLIQLAYRAKDSTGSRLARLEVGNVTFVPPASRLITGGIPRGNYGVQAQGRIAGLHWSGIVAQQSGNVSKDLQFTVGAAGVSQGAEREIEDYQVEARRFFFTVDPRTLTRWPDLDILNGAQMRAAAAALPDSLRPTRVVLYRLIIGGQPPNPNGPQFRLIGRPDIRPGQVYEVLRENVDYYTDPSLLWVALVRPLNLNNERLAVAYTVRIGGRDTTLVSTGGTPDLEHVPGREQWANLLWDPQLRPGDPAFDREIRAVYRVGGEDVRRESVSARIVTGPAGDQEKPLAGASDTWLQQFGLAQVGNPSTFDIENRLFPRPGDPNAAVGGAAATRILRDVFLVFPSLRPFARGGLAGPPPNPANDSIYVTPGEDLYSTQHPPSFYRLRLRYESDGGSERGVIALPTVQLRPFSERVSLEGRPLRRDVDYTVDYELGRITFLRTDSLFPRARQVTVRYEENPLFATAPTTILGMAGRIPLERGEVTMLAIAQRQRSTFNRPPIGFESQSILLAGVAGRFEFEAQPLADALRRLPGLRESTAPTRIRVEGEAATSRPQLNAQGQAYIESFEGEGGIGITLSDQQWGASSQPALGRTATSRLGAGTLDLSRAATLAWQTNALRGDGSPYTFTIAEIDPNVRLAGAGVAAPENVLWLTLYPLSVGGLRDEATGRYRWTVAGAPGGRRWRSLRTVLSPTGLDASRIEQLEFWTLVDTAQSRRGRNPALLIDLGDVSENAVAVAPTRMTVTQGATGRDTTFAGRQVVGRDTLDTERDPFSRAFDQLRDDRGLPGDRVPRLDYAGPDSVGVLRDLPLCAQGNLRVARLGDNRTNCTVRNGRLDEEDVDADLVLNFDSAQREQERLFRFTVDLADPVSWTRVGGCPTGLDLPTPRCWVLVRLPFRTPADTVSGGPNPRRVRAARVTVVSGAQAADDEFTQLALARLRLVGSPWLKRADRVVRGIGGDRLGEGTVQASLIGTLDRDSTAGLDYVSPPGVLDQPDSPIQGLGAQQLVVNERSLRLTAQRLALHERAEAFFRFPEGQKNFMPYRELRLWARGRGNGWGERGDLQFYVKIGRDENNFYAYRVPVNTGSGEAAWLPEVRVDFEKLFRLRARLQNSFLQARPDSIACTGADSALVAQSRVPVSQAGRRYAACADGYIVYTTDPAVTPPNLAAVQELAVGIVRVDSTVGGATGILPGDTLEVWVNDIRLSGVVNTPGYAGTFGFEMDAGELGTVRVGVNHRDPWFRQLTDATSFVSDNAVELSTALRLDKLLPQRWGLVAPLTVGRSLGQQSPYFLTRSDLRGEAVEALRTPRADATRVTLALRRGTPLTDSPWAPLVNHLSAQASYDGSRSRSEFQDGAARGLTMGVDYAVSAAPRTTPLPWLERAVDALPRALAGTAWAQAIRGAALRWNPTEVRLGSGLARSRDRRRSYLQPAGALADTGRLVQGDVRVWRTGSALELRPFSALTARWDFASVRDLRDYGDSTPQGVVAGSERGRLLGLDAGLERERQMRTTLGFSPLLATWLQSRLELSSTYDFLRDPNSRQVLTDTATGLLALPRRAANGRVFTATGALDWARLAAALGADSGGAQRLLSRLLPLDLNWERRLNSAFDGATTNPGGAYQWGVGGLDDFRAPGGTLATTAGEFTQASVGAGVRLPLGVAVTGRTQRVTTRNWTRRLAGTQALVEGEQRTYPDLTVRWSWRPARFEKVVRSVGSSVRLLRTRQSTLAPGEFADVAADLRVSRVQSLPLNGTVTWGGTGNLTTSFGWSRTERLDSLPGSVTDARIEELSATLARQFPLPAAWELRSDLRTSVAFQQSSNLTIVRGVLGGAGSRLADNGRQALSLNADTDVAENLTFSLQGSRVLTFDRNLNRRVSQLVFTVVFQLGFFSGEIR